MQLRNDSNMAKYKKKVGIHAKGRVPADPDTYTHSSGS